MKNRISIEEIKRLHKGHWFDEDTMHFFRTRLPYNGFVDSAKTFAYFITSEEYKSRDKISSGRYYTLRKCNLQTGDINTVGEFNKMSKTEAKKQLLERVKC